MALVGRQPGADMLREHWALVTGVGAAMAILGVLALGNLWDATVITTFIIGIVLILICLLLSFWVAFVALLIPLIVIVLIAGSRSWSAPCPRPGG